ncbi:MAG: hypothetical protein JW818_05595 [Pirellulales bacterium]|nr:hypothetical protein [Pirellulales bacterium]
MARTYAGILGLVAMLTSIVRGVLYGAGTDSLMFSAFCSLWVFAAIGYVLGRCGQWMMDQSVQTRIEAEIKAEEAREAQAAAAKPAA